MTAQTIEILNLGVNNIRSLAAAISEVARANVRIINEARESETPSFLVLPGTGSFKQGVTALEQRGFRSLIQHEVIGNKLPILGVCLGMQLLASGSEEAPGAKGIGLLEQQITRLKPTQNWKVPHVGWNTAVPSDGDSDWMTAIGPRDYYFSHSFALFWDGLSASMRTDFADSSFVSAFCLHQNIYGAQFHPEKSSKNGLEFLKKVFVEHVEV